MDARSICIEAKLSLGVMGYPTQEQKELLLEEGVRLYEQRPLNVQEAMRSNRQSFDAMIPETISIVRNQLNGSTSTESLSSSPPFSHTKKRRSAGISPKRGA